MVDLFNYTRRASSVAHIGALDLGGDNPIRIQSMTTTNTNDTEACVRQAEEIIKAGGELVRFTTQGSREAENMKNINAGIRADGYQTPLVADVHFNPNVADVAALYCEKVRVNPGNYVDPARKFIKQEYTDEEYAHELQKIEDRFVPFLNICKENHTAIRIGVNHGSLSDRIRNRYGDTPEGIVESCLEFLRICKKENFHDVVISIKSSNTVVMVRSMLPNVEADTQQAYNEDPRITPLGHFLRVTSLDELPQFWNVLKGDMSVVGPRPHMLIHTEQYCDIIPEYNKRLIVKPGITGWAQIHNLRGETEKLDKMKKRVEYDIWYIEHWSFSLDLKIMFNTIKIIFR